uniref:Uncharacterized protein n=1 Tax=Fagus sylvatica TaxID=28930 RepID=A0A2N9IUX1_FAGSY
MDKATSSLTSRVQRKDHYSSSSTTNSDSMEMITGAEAPEYLKRPCAKKEDTIGAPTKDIATPTMNGVGHKVQSTVAKPCRGKDLEGTRDNHKRLEKGSENAESETESEEVKTSHTPMWPQKGQMVQNIGDIEDIEDIENIEDTKDMEDIENIENVEDLEGFGNIEGVENFENIEGIDDIEVEEADDIEEMEGSEAMECTETNIQTRKPNIKEEDVRGATLILLADDEECRDIGIDQNGNTSKVTVGPKEPLTMEDLFKLSQNLEETKTRPKVENGLDYYVEMLNKPADTRKGGHRSGPKKLVELPGLSRKLVEHRLPIKEGFQPFQQPSRRMAPDITLKIKEGIERLV